MATESSRAISPTSITWWTKPCAPARASEASGKVFNGGTGARITLNEVLKLLGKITGKKIQPQYDPPRNGDIRDSQADISLARKMLGYEPLVHFEEGLKRTWDWYKSAYAAASASSPAVLRRVAERPWLR